MSGGTTVAKKKSDQRSPKNKERQAPGFTTKAIRMSDGYAEWIERAAKADRTTVAGFLDRAAADRAKAIGFDEAPPERIP
jgi:hypothetical protein